jgi:hypothetical protein
MINNPEAAKHFFEINFAKFNRCLCPGMLCQGTAIKAHSIQNSRAIGLLADEGHVIGLTLRFSKNGPDFDFRRIGRNDASIFTGFCGRHDTEIFRPIEVEEIDLQNSSHLFLLAYRSVTRELHVVMEAAIKAQTNYEWFIEKGADSPTDMGPAGLMATEALIKSYDTHLYREHWFDHNLLTGAPGNLVHDVILLEGQKPSITTSALRHPLIFEDGRGTS